ncbi:hypothetical protein [Microbacterium sp. WCS2018Hpa-9]|uniref:hypothetical protein n=1 Tax=Microbacterium sp. WCS2018Hpa-9 TaxID=3073635 RepID=UPI00288C4A4A|nr:hypothetical protein [Microbacterium sp. WCS2018Hpa-9]
MTAGGTGVRPRSVLVASDQLYRRMAQDKDSVALLEDVEAMVVPFSDEPQANAGLIRSVREIVAREGKLVSGALLIKNPYDADGYEFAEHAVETFASEKYHHLANVARILGASEVQFVDAKIEKADNSVQVGGKMKLPTGAGDVGAGRDVSKKLEQRLAGHMEFPGADSEPDLAAAYVAKHNLSNDHQLTALVEMRTGLNPLSRYKMTLSGTREAEANLRSALRLATAGLVKAADIGADFSRTVKSISSVEITTEITF